MNTYICHTPLHVLLAALESGNHKSASTLYFVIEDTPGLHSLAHALLSSETARFSMLPGTASTGMDHIALQKENYRVIRKQASQYPPKHIFIFFDQRAEAQAILNINYKEKPNVTLIEDGVSIYFVSSPFQKPIINLLRRKIRFDIHWKGAKWLGQHPSINRVRCFYPKLLRADLKKKSVAPISKDICHKNLDAFLEFYGPARYKLPVAIIVLPHPDNGLSDAALENFIERSISYCEHSDLKPVLKIHPRDTTTEYRLREFYSQINIAQQNLPLELILYAESQIEAIIGYRTSTLHITRALHPSVKTFYYESLLSSFSDKWRAFYDETSIPALPQFSS